jgi:hypothetical protein
MSLRKSIILYGVAMAVLMGILKFAEYRFYVRDLLSFISESLRSSSSPSAFG